MATLLYSAGLEATFTLSPQSGKTGRKLELAF
jgi:hypothetical protein